MLFKITLYTVTSEVLDLSDDPQTSQKEAEEFAINRKATHYNLEKIEAKETTFDEIYHEMLNDLK